MVVLRDTYARDVNVVCLTSSAEAQAEGGMVMAPARSARGRRVAVKVIAKWKEGIEVLTVFTG